MKQPRYETLTLDKIVGGGQALGTLLDGRKAFVWSGLPAEKVTIRVTKKKSRMVEGVVTEVLIPCSDRIAPLDPDSYLSTSPWQIMTPSAEQHYKAALIEEAFELHDIVLPDMIDVYTDNHTSQYRNKMEYSWFGSSVVAGERSDSPISPDEGPAFPAEASQERKLDQLATSRPEAGDDRTRAIHTSDTLDLAFFIRGGKGKYPVESSSLAHPAITQLSLEIRDLLRTKDITARNLKTLLIRCNQKGQCVWQLYLKDKLPSVITKSEARQLSAQGGELIYSDPRSPASRITERLAAYGDTVLTDTILGVPFRYATEGFFQVNIPVYEQALQDMRVWVGATSTSSDEGSAFPAEASQERKLDQLATSRPEAGDGGSSTERLTDILNKSTSQNKADRTKRVIDLYSGVGSIGLTIGGDNVTLVEINEDAVREMRRNITELGKEDIATAVLAPSEKALDTITSDAIVILDPPRAGLHADVIAKLLEAAPERIVYLSCNPVTQARDIALLAETYGIRAHRGYNFFPRTPHIEHLIVLDKKP